MGEGFKNSAATIFPLAIAHLVGLGAVQLALLLVFFDWRLAIIPLVLYVVLCLVAPFFPRWNFFLPVISASRHNHDSVAITFDDGPDTNTTPLLLDLLKKNNVRAAFFVVGQKALGSPEIIRRMIDEGHEVCNHTNSHDVFLALRRKKRLEEEIARCQDALSKCDVLALAFRPPVGITNPRMWPVLLELGMFCVTYSNRAVDFGNRKIGKLAHKILNKAKGGDIILLHDHLPAANSTTDWLHQVELLLDGLKNRNLKVKVLSKIIERPVMMLNPKGAPGAVRGFYDGLAIYYDEEQEKGKNGTVRKTENELIEKFIDSNLQPENSVLEIGAGTGRHTFKIANKAKIITAVDISPYMLAVLEKKAKESDIRNVKTLAGDVSEMDFDESFDVICSFSCFEYFQDLDGLLQKINAWLRPGGLLYFTTSHRSFFRFFAQVGNALRQGVWLHARSVPEIEKNLRNAGFDPLQIRTGGLNSVFSKGVLIEVLARKEHTITGN